MKLAIVGAGISGLVAAYRLHPEHRITVFEAGGHAGGHAHTVDVERAGQRYAIDTGFVVFNDRTYPQFSKLLAELGVPSRPTIMGFSVRDERTGLEYNGHSLNTLFAQRRNLLRPGFYRLLADIVRFNRQARGLVGGCDDRTTVAEFLWRHRFSPAFAQQYLLPMGAAIWSCPLEAFGRFPIRLIVDFYHNHGLLDIFGRPTWRTVVGGSRTYVKALIRGFQERIRLNTPVESVVRFADHVTVRLRGSETEHFDHLIFACHSDQALRILGNQATEAEREVLSAFRYLRNAAVLHTDVSVLPQSRRAWASWNYRLTGEAARPATVSYNMNLLQGIEADEIFCLTLNDEARIAPDCILRRLEFWHPVFTIGKAAAQARQAEFLNQRRTSFCGAYWGNGFHENGVNSALAVVDAIRRTGVTMEKSNAGRQRVAS
jgi:predicted NAD/FAD-binding protein